jgi:hypothetical protein
VEAQDLADFAWAPVGVDVNTPNVARMYDYFLGGKDHFPADRAAADKILEVVPEVPAAVRGSRDFLMRAVRYLTDAGMRQFIDIGTGLPTQDNVHQVAQRVAPDSRVVYVDNDPVVLAHARALLADVDQVNVLKGDLRRPEEIIEQADGFIDFTRPVAIMLVAILHFVPDAADPFKIVGRLREAMAPGSHLALAHATADEGRPEDVPRVLSVYERSNAPVVMRTHQEILGFFDELELLPPGLVYTADWRPGDAAAPPGAAEKSHVYCAVARKNPA